MALKKVCEISRSITAHTIRSIQWIVWDFSGLHFIWGKIAPQTHDKKKPPTFFLWLIGIYIASFGIAAQKYENSIDRIENRSNAIFAQLSIAASAQDNILKKNALSRISNVQHMPCPYRPEILAPLTVFRSLLSKDGKYEEMILLLKETIENWKASLGGVNLEGVNLEEANLSEANLTGANLQKTLLIKSFLKGANLSRANLQKANLDEANLNRANLKGTNLSEAHLRKANLQGACIEGTNFSKADLRKSDLQETFGSLCYGKVYWETIDLGGANFNEAYIREANLGRANLRDATFISADLGKTNLQGAKIEGTNLSGAYLGEANLSGAYYLESANLSGAFLWKTNLVGLRVSCIDLVVQQLSNTKSLYMAKIDIELEKNIKKNIPTF